jgi:hypothetical protein
MHFWLGASGAKKLCALGAKAASVRPLNFPVRRRVNLARISAVVVLGRQALICNP